MFQPSKPSQESGYVIPQNQSLQSEALELAKIGLWHIDLSSNEGFWFEQVYRIYEIEPGTPIQLDQAIGFYRPDFQPLIHTAIERSTQDGQEAPEL